MFFGKLWIRIKGEIAILRESFSGSEDLRPRAENLFRQLGACAKNVVRGNDSTKNFMNRAGQNPESHKQKENERKQNDFKILMSKDSTPSQDSDDRDPNPRVLG